MERIEVGDSVELLMDTGVSWAAWDDQAQAAVTIPAGTVASVIDVINDPWSVRAFVLKIPGRRSFRVSPREVRRLSLLETLAWQTVEPDRGLSGAGA